MLLPTKRLRTWNLVKHNCLKLFNQEDFLELCQIDLLVHWLKVPVPLAIFLTPLATMAPAFVIDGTIRENECVRSCKSRRRNVNMNDIIRTINSLENLRVLVDGVSKTIKYEIKKWEGGFLGILLRTLGASMLANTLNGKGVMRNQKGVMRARRGFCNKDYLDKDF